MSLLRELTALRDAMDRGAPLANENLADELMNQIDAILDALALQEAITTCGFDSYNEHVLARAAEIRKEAEK